MPVLKYREGGVTKTLAIGGSGPDPTGATDGYVWTADGADGAAWEAPTGGGGNIEYSVTEPSSPTDGMVWIKKTT